MSYNNSRNEYNGTCKNSNAYSINPFKYVLINGVIIPAYTYLNKAFWLINS